MGAYRQDRLPKAPCDLEEIWSGIAEVLAGTLMDCARLTAKLSLSCALCADLGSIGAHRRRRRATGYHCSTGERSRIRASRRPV